MTSGTQAPSRSFRMLAAKNVCSISRRGTVTTAAFQTGQRQYFQMTKKAMMVSMTMAAVTEMPYAAARFCRAAEHQHGDDDAAV